MAWLEAGPGAGEPCSGQVWRALLSLGQDGGGAGGGCVGRRRLCPRAPAGVPLLGTPPLRRSQRAGDPLARLAYLDGLGQHAILAAESCQGPAEESPPAARARRPGRLCSGRGPSPRKGPGQPPPPPAGPACCQGKESKEPWRRSARRALPDPLSAVPPLLSARERRRLGTRVPGGSALSCRRAMGTDVPCGKGSSSPSAARVPACTRRREGRPAPVFSKLTSRAARSTLAARGDGWWPLLCASLQETRHAH